MIITRRFFLFNLYITYMKIRTLFLSFFIIIIFTYNKV